MNLTFKGGKEFARFLQQLPGMVSAEILERSLVAGALIIQERAVAKCPKPALRRRPNTERLADSIHVTTKEKDAAHATVHVGTKVPYAHLVEYGHQIVPRGPGRRFELRQVGTRVVTRRILTLGGQIAERQETVAVRKRFELPRQAAKTGAGGFVAPRPFLRPAFDESREEVVARIGESMGRQIEQEARRIAQTGAA